MSLIRHKPAKRLSEAVVINGLAFLAGQVPGQTLEQDITAQTTEVLAGIDTVLAELGTDKSKLIDATIFLANIEDFEGMNIAWDAWVNPAQLPSRATVEAKLAHPQWRVEIKVIAAL